MTGRRIFVLQIALAISPVFTPDDPLLVSAHWRYELGLLVADQSFDPERR